MTEMEVMEILKSLQIFVYEFVFSATLAQFEPFQMSFIFEKNMYREDYEKVCNMQRKKLKIEEILHISTFESKDNVEEVCISDLVFFASQSISIYSVS